jgi:hypothetical protein
MIEHENCIIFPNVHEFMFEGMDSDYEYLSEWRNIGAGYSEVSSMWSGKNKLILAPKPVDNNFIEHIKNVFGYEIMTITPKTFSSKTASDFLNDVDILNEIKCFAKKYESLKFMAWGATQGAYALLNKIRSFNPSCFSDMPVESHAWTVSQYDSKIGFKRLCEMLHLDIPIWYSCANLNEAFESINAFHKNGKPCVLKANYGVGGFGNIFINNELLLQPFSTVCQHILQQSGGLPYFKNGSMLVEEFIEAPNGGICSGFASAEILADKSVEIIVGGADIHGTTGYYEGATLGRGVLTEELWQKLKNIMLQIGNEIANNGYVGHWGINFMVRKTGEITLIEMNPRRCGESHIHNMVKQFFGDKWMSEKFILTRLPRNVKLLQNQGYFQDVLNIFAKLGERSNDIFLMPTQLSWLNNATYPGIGYVVVGESKACVANFELLLLDELSKRGVVA